MPGWNTKRNKHQANKNRVQSKFNSKNSIGSKVGSSLGGHLSSINNKPSSGLSISGVMNSIAEGWGNFMANPANAMGDITGKLSQLELSLIHI